MNIGEGNIIQGQLEKALNGKTFFVFDRENKKSFLPSCEADVFWFYYDVFENCENFGLPRGRGWLDEPPWLLLFLRAMRTVKEKVYGKNQTYDKNEPDPGCARN